MRKPKTSNTVDLSQRFTLGVAETCAALGIGKTACYELINAGAFESFLLGSQRLITSASIHRWVEAMANQHRIDKGVSNVID